MTPSGIKLVTFLLVAQYINQLRYRVPPRLRMGDGKFIKHSSVRPCGITQLEDAVSDREIML